MTNAQLNEANAGHAFAVMAALEVGERRVLESDMESLARPRSTRAKTYRTICMGVILAFMPSDQIQPWTKGDKEVLIG